jgi:hypothetical protein
MQWLSRSDLLVLGVAIYFAVMSLVRLMQRRRDALVADVQRQVDARRKHPKRSNNSATRDAA